MLLVCDAPQSVSYLQPLGLGQGVRMTLQDRDHTHPLVLSLQCDGLCCCLSLPSSPSTFSCTAAFWTRSWRNLSWIYQGQRGKALLCFATLPTLIHNPSRQALAPGQKDREAQPAIPPGVVNGVSTGRVVPCSTGSPAQNKVLSPGYASARDLQSCAGEGTSLSLSLPSPQACPRDVFPCTRHW